MPNLPEVIASKSSRILSVQDVSTILLANPPSLRCPHRNPFLALDAVPVMSTISLLAGRSGPIHACTEAGSGYNLAFEYFKMSAENVEPDFEAQYELAKCYDMGLGTDKNPEEAKKWYAIAKENGYEPDSE